MASPGEHWRLGSEIGWAFGCCRRGPSHVREGKPCQDACGLWSGSAGGSPCLIVAVADGHGDERHDLSHLGAAFAVKAAVDELLSLYTRSGPETSAAALKRTFKADFPRRLGKRWRDAVLEDARERIGDLPDPHGDNQHLFVRYGTTLLTALATEAVLLLGQIGDGAIFLLRPGARVERPFPLEGSEVGVSTFSLCSSDAPHRWQTAALERGDGGTLFLTTDGLVNAFADDAGLSTFGRSLAERIREYGLNQVAASLPGWLDRYSAQGSGDDVTLALVCLDPRAPPAPAAERPPQPTEELRDVTGIGATGAGGDGGPRPDRQGETG